MYNVQCTMYNVQCTMYNVQCTMYNVQHNMYNVQCTMYNVQCTMYNVQCTMYNVQCTMYNVQCTLSCFTELFLNDELLNSMSRLHYLHHTPTLPHYTSTLRLDYDYFSPILCLHYNQHMTLLRQRYAQLMSMPRLYITVATYKRARTIYS